MFKIGDVVILKSGGMPMTVLQAEDDQTTCIWMGEEGEIFRETLPTLVLEPVDEEDEDEDDDDSEAKDDETQNDEDDDAEEEEAA